ncbi:hypothetical protein QYE76_027146 [Lolium multiflorum]|uniref:Uncharacterized protein n=1 Tax=Lolium multiflorum TaxID=4521 RepID=A0AAD8PTG8_LOLMU|nr:hypothetical protein QYE76_027146 [Lolium multiflorum]
MEPIIPMEPFIQTQVYELGNGGDLIFERDLHALSEFLGRSPPVFYGGQVNDQPGGQLQWVIMANLPGKPESPMFRQIQFSLRENNWADGLARALQEALARLYGQNSVAIQGERFAHFARHTSLGLPINLPFHPVMRHHVDHLDFMLWLDQQAETIKVIAKERRTLRLNAKKDYTIHRLKAKIAALKETIATDVYGCFYSCRQCWASKSRDIINNVAWNIRNYRYVGDVSATQAEQLKELEGEGEGEDIQGDGYSYVSNDDDYEEEEDEDLVFQDGHEHLTAGMDDTFPINVDGE